jgi:predicted P-loop ATPase
MTGVAQYRSKDSFDYRFSDLTKEAMNTMSIRALKAGLDSWDKDIKRYVESTMIPEYDPVNEWLEQLPKWDGQDRVTSLAERIKTSNLHWTEDFHKWLLSMVAHWKGIDRNHGNAIVPMLIGPQGCGKTSFCGILLPEELRDYYNDKIDFKNETAINLGLTSFALINIDEFDMLSKSQQPLLKHLISKSDVKMRPPYGKAYEQRRRYASFIATTNNMRPLPDDKSGSRRFVCIVVENQIDTLTPIDYPQLYAQLVAEIARGDRYWFDEDENQRIIDENRQFERVGSLEKMISLTFRRADDKDKSKLKSVDEIVEILNNSFPNFHLTKNINVEVGRALNRLGYSPHKTMTCQKYSIEIIH